MRLSFLLNILRIKYVAILEIFNLVGNSVSSKHLKSCSRMLLFGFRSKARVVAASVILLASFSCPKLCLPISQNITFCASVSIDV